MNIEDSIDIILGTDKNIWMTMKKGKWYTSVRPRHIYIYLRHKYSGGKFDINTLSSIGTIKDLRFNHSTVIYAINNVISLMDTSNDFRDKINDIEKLFSDREYITLIERMSSEIIRLSNCVSIEQDILLIAKKIKQ